MSPSNPSCCSLKMLGSFTTVENGGMAHGPLAARVAGCCAWQIEMRRLQMTICSTGGRHLGRIMFNILNTWARRGAVGSLSKKAAISSWQLAISRPTPKINGNLITAEDAKDAEANRFSRESSE